MRSRLDRIKDWEDRARKAAYQVTRLARHAGTTRQHLNRYFHSRSGQSIHEWVWHLRMNDGMSLLQQGKLIKEVAHELGYANASHFGRAMRRYRGEFEIETLACSDFPPVEMFQNDLKCSKMVSLGPCDSPLLSELINP